MSQASDAHTLDSPSTMTRFKPELLLSLPDVPTLSILSLPLQQLIVNLPLVHPRLAPIRQSILKGTQRLTIYIGDQQKIKHVKIGSRFALPFARNTDPLCPDPNWSELNQLHLATLDSQTVGQLTSLMPGMVHLQVVITHVPISVLPQLAILLAHWAPSLQTLKLKIGKLFPNERLGLIREPLYILTSNVRLLLQAINPKFVALQHLTLDIGKLIDDAQFANEFLVGDQTGDPLNLSILGQLREFYLDLGKGANGQSFLSEAQKKYATEKLTSIGLQSINQSIIRLGNSKENLNELANSSFSIRTAFKPESLIGLPDVPTLAILSLLPLQQLIVNLPRVHRRLAPIRENVLTGTQRLAIYIGDQGKIKQVQIGSRFVLPFSSNTGDSTEEPLCPDSDWSELNQLRLATLDYRAVGQLSSLMPGIVHLQVVIADAPITVLPQLAILLAHWAPSLQTLKLHIEDLFPNERLGLIGDPLYILTSNLRVLLQAINRKFVALQHLTLDIGRLIDDAPFVDEFFFGCETGVPLSLPILGQLREFYLSLGKCANGQTFLLEALKEHATEKLTCIGLKGVPFENLNALANSLWSPRTDLKFDLLLSLPDVPTLAILSLLPLQQLIVNLPRVHPRLAPIRQNILQGTQRLVLHIGDQRGIKARQFNSPLRFPFASHLVDSTGALLYPETDTPFNTLHLTTLNDHYVEQLSSLMPAIIHLKVVISHAPISVLTQLTSLLGHWAPTLRTLEVISGDFNFGAIPSFEARKVATSTLRHLIDEINSKLVALQTLSLDIGKGFDLNYAELLSGGQTDAGPLRLPILGQLREFYFSLGIWASAPGFLLGQLEKYASEKLTSIALGGNLDGILKYAAESDFAEHFTMVKLNDLPIRRHIPFLPSFTNLTVFAFNWVQLNAPELIDHLRVLSSLSHLQCLQIYGFSPVSHPLPAYYTDLPSLKSVTVLEIVSLQNVEPDHLQAPNWWTLFPSVQILKVKDFGQFYAICYPGENGRFARLRTTNYAPFSPCLRQLFAPLRVLPSLRKIFYQRKDFIAEFTPQGEFVRTHEFIG